MEANKTWIVAAARVGECKTTRVKRRVSRSRVRKIQKQRVESGQETDGHW